ncbi:MAG TPA: sigma 54-interacting transcriptional regulator [Terriglobales bacterium]|nr:sigma 54-interacting transcriptional regulator [Terriglobales bacterium]
MQQVPERHSDSDPIQGFDESSRRYRVLLHAAEIAARGGFPQLLEELSRLLHELFDFNFLNYALRDDRAEVMRVYMLNDVIGATESPLELSVEESPAGWVWSHQQPLVIPDLAQEQRFCSVLELYSAKGFRSVISVPMTTARRRLGSLSFGSAQQMHCDSSILYFLERLASLVALALENYLFVEVPLLTEATAGEQRQLRQLVATQLQLTQKSTEAYESLRREREQLETIIEILSGMGASQVDLHQMFPAICRSLYKAIEHDAAVITLVDSTGQNYDVYAVESKTSPQLLSQGMKIKADESFAPFLLARAPDGDIVGREELERKAPQTAHAKRALEAGLVNWCVVPMRTPNRLVGIFAVGGRRENAFTQHDLDLLRQLAGAMGLFLAKAQSRAAVQIEKERLDTLLEISRTLTSTLDWKKLFQDMSTCLRRLTAEEYAHFALFEPAGEVMRFHALDYPEGSRLVVTGTTVPVLACPSGIAFHARETKIFAKDDLENIGSEFTRKVLAEGIQKACCVPLISRGRALGTLGVASLKPDPFLESEIELLQQVAPQIAIALDNSRAYAEISSLKDKLTKEKVYLEQEIRDSFNFENFVGQSSTITYVLEQVRTVAPNSATVLILGETGTGKEMIARGIHRLSTRASASFVKLNCAAIPTGLLESELFGHEKGAFTGAITQKVGRLELADKGTLFLDEVGEIPLELQPKLLRVLQDQEFERLGGTRTIRVNVRLVAATNRDLAAAVAKHEFRADLYYRLHVFPIRMPALRERTEDIPSLVRFFVQKFARNMNKQIETIPAETMQALAHWHWPGNIRELENFIERSVILTEGTTLRVPVGELNSLSGPADDSPRTHSAISSSATLEELEREYILQVLRKSGGVIAGSNGAAARLGMKRTTLQSKIQRLGIDKEEYAC